MPVQVPVNQHRGQKQQQAERKSTCDESALQRSLAAACVRAAVQHARGAQTPGEQQRHAGKYKRGAESDCDRRREHGTVPGRMQRPADHAAFGNTVSKQLEREKAQRKPQCERAEHEQRRLRKCRAQQVAIA